MNGHRLRDFKSRQVDDIRDCEFCGALESTWVAGEKCLERQSDLQPIGSFSVLSDPDRKTVQLAQSWLRKVFLQSGDTLPAMGLLGTYTFRFDGLERDALFEISERLTELLTHTAGEPQLIGN